MSHGLAGAARIITCTSLAVAWTQGEKDTYHKCYSSAFKKNEKALKWDLPKISLRPQARQYHQLDHQDRDTGGCDLRRGLGGYLVDVRKIGI